MAAKRRGARDDETGGDTKDARRSIVGSYVYQRRGMSKNMPSPHGPDELQV
jgi:hypothetical protein